MSFAQNTPVHFIPGIGVRTAKVLHGLGLHTAGQLNNVPENILVEIFGPSIRTVLKTLQTPPVQKEIQPSTNTITGEKRNIFEKIRTAAQFVSVL